jgi:catechol 2,3-dioxygenase-like lactoylglutathione lyase family enzyme
VSDLERSVRFYRTLFAQEPAKHLPDYAKFEVESPPLVVALYPSPQAPGGALNHVGLRFPDSANLVEVQRRLEEAGIATQRQEGVECCYSRQTKFWVTDPDKTLWEIYTLHEDIDHSGFDDPPASPDRPTESVWQHRLTEPVPNSIPREACTLDEVLLEGTVNAAIATDALNRLLGEARRVLKPGGRIAVHGLVSNRPFPGTPKLPGLASLVQRVPVETEVLTLLRSVGFETLEFEKLGDIHCFGVAGVELREMRLVGRSPVSEAGLASIVYKGPFEEIVAADGTRLPRGKAVQVSKSLAKSLGVAAGDQFAFLPD